MPFNGQEGRGISSGPLWNSLDVKGMDEGKEKVEGSRNQYWPVSH